MLASLKILPVLFGVGGGGLVATILSLVLWAGLASIGMSDAPLAGLTAAIVIGLIAAGYVAGRFAPHTQRFHGSVSGLLMSTVVYFIAVLGGSPASIGQILLLLGLGMVLGGVGGVLGGRSGPKSQ